MTYPINLNNAPACYDKLTQEPDFNPALHLALEKPTEVISLSAFGYSAEDIAECPSDFAVSNVFRVLSQEGAVCLYQVCKQLQFYARSNPRIEQCTRGGVYRSKFLRDLCLSPEVTEFLSEFVGVRLMPHTIPHQLGHINYAPQKVGDNVDKWHVDTLRYDYVMFVTDPNKNKGGEFQYFKGTKHELAQIRAAGKTLPLEKIISPTMPGAGYAVMQQGNMVVHRAKGLAAVGERITMVNGYITESPFFADYTRYDQLLFADPPEVITAEFTRHNALHVARLLQAHSDLDLSAKSPENMAATLEQSAQSLLQAAQQIRGQSSAQMEHFGDD